MAKNTKTTTANNSNKKTSSQTKDPKGTTSGTTSAGKPASGKKEPAQRTPPAPPVEEEQEQEAEGVEEAEEQEEESTGQEEEGAGSEEGAEGDAFAVFGGEELQVEKRRKDAHEGVISAVTYTESTQKSTPGIQVTLISSNTGNQDDWTIWLPRTFAENTGAFIRGEMGIEDLNPGEPDPERPGKLKGNERAQYGMAIKNSAGDAAIQTLLAVAAKSGRTPSPEFVQLVTKTKKEVTLEDYIEELNNILSELPVVYVRVPQVSDENPRGYLHVNRVYHPDDVIGDDKKLKNYLKHWEAAAQG